MRRSSIILLVTVAFVLVFFVIINSSSSSRKLDLQEEKEHDDESLDSPASSPKITSTPNRLPTKRTSTTSRPSSKSQQKSSSSSKFEVIPVYDCDQMNRNNNPKQKHWTLVIGIPSVDRPVSLERRNRQRDTWFKYTSVGTSILPRYLLGLHPTHNYQMSSALKQEVQSTSDIIVFDLKEGKPNNKTVGGGGYWGMEAEVGMSRKAYFWYVFAAKNYPKASFIAKADDDLFLRANLISSILNEIMMTTSSGGKQNKNNIFDMNKFHRHDNDNNDDTHDNDERRDVSASSSSTTVTCPHNHLYWGRVMKWGAVKNDPKSKFPFVGGMFILMSRPLVEWIASSPIPAKNSQEAFRGDSPSEKFKYKETSHDHEDVMVGKWFYRARLPVCVVSDCRFHDVHVGANLGKVRPSSIGMHHLKVEEYSQFMSKYPDADGSQVVKMVTKDAMDRLSMTTMNGGSNKKKKVLQGYAQMHYMC